MKPHLLSPLKTKNNMGRCMNIQWNIKAVCPTWGKVLTITIGKLPKLGWIYEILQELNPRCLSAVEMEGWMGIKTKGESGGAKSTAFQTVPVEWWWENYSSTPCAAAAMTSLLFPLLCSMTFKKLFWVQFLGSIQPIYLFFTGISPLEWA